MTYILFPFSYNFLFIPRVYRFLFFLICIVFCVICCCFSSCVYKTSQYFNHECSRNLVVWFFFFLTKLLGAQSSVPFELAASGPSALLSSSPLPIFQIDHKVLFFADNCSNWVFCFLQPKTILINKWSSNSLVLCPKKECGIFQAVLHYQLLQLTRKSKLV